MTRKRYVSLQEPPSTTIGVSAGKAALVLDVPAAMRPTPISYPTGSPEVSHELEDDMNMRRIVRRISLVACAVLATIGSGPALADTIRVNDVPTTDGLTLFVAKDQGFFANRGTRRKADGGTESECDDQCARVGIVRCSAHGPDSCPRCDPGRHQAFGFCRCLRLSYHPAADCRRNRPQGQRDQESDGPQGKDHRRRRARGLPPGRWCSAGCARTTPTSNQCASSRFHSLKCRICLAPAMWMLSSPWIPSIRG